MNINLRNYKSLVFDCDGVVLNSNKIKSQAFYEATKHFGNELAKAFVDYNVANGGISRYAKVRYFISDILKQEFNELIYQDILERFAKAVKKGLMNCEIAEGLAELRDQTKETNWLIVSGGDQAELREVFAARGLSKYFDGGVFGSPDNKDLILAREIERGNIYRPALFLGDSKYDFLAAKTASLDFLFLTQWSEVKSCKAWCNERNIMIRLNLRDLL